MERKTSDQLECLYYPFSRLLDSTTLKYLLLVFDSMTFIDEAESAKWRETLFKVMAKVDGPLFSTYDELVDDYDMLYEKDIVKIINPRKLYASHSQEVALATVADLSDQQFVKLASNPNDFGLPARPLGRYGRMPEERPTWQVFIGKIASPLLDDELIFNNEIWNQHILVPGDDNTSWSLSYEAGSAAVINYYLDASRELQLVPITTSNLHHELVIRKLKRILSSGKNEIGAIDDLQRRRFRNIYGQGEIIRLLNELYPVNSLTKISFEEILKFRDETSEQRIKFNNEITEMLRVIDSDPCSATYDKEVVEAVDKLKIDLRNLENELITIRDKLLPAIAASFMYGAVGGSALGTFSSFLGGFSPYGLLLGSALTTSGALLTRTLEIWNEKKKLIREQSPSISYLAKLSEFIKK